ncbi:unnamed protein product [Phaedon cochleariae]|uniref:Uncharacterized protein n=1 Tax=Phaedon cochleariae TaxID=80249 RepID=A0A9N9S7Z9_PHACE|nr:unnamed protein product [Phaedon cochleariae]
MASNRANVCESALKNKSCNKCKKNLVKGVKCTLCENNFHTSCARNINVKFLNEDMVICCPSEKVSCDNDQAFFDAMENLAGESKVVDLNIFNYIVKQKDEIIQELRDKIDLMQEQIVLLKGMTNVSPVKSLGDTNKKQDSGKNDSHIADKENVSRPVNLNPPNSVAGCSKISDSLTITEKHVSQPLLQLATQQKCEEIINLANNMEANSSDWKLVKRAKPRRKLVVGDNSSIKVNGKELKGIPKMACLHVYRVDPTMTAEELKQSLTPHFSEVKIETLTSKHPDIYASFKVSIHESHFDAAMDPTKWPKGAYVQRFLNFRRSVNPPPT